MPNIDDLIKAEIAATTESEWTGTLGGETLVLRARPICPADITIVERRFPGFTQKGGVGGMLAMIVLKATDSEGVKVFKRAHEQSLAQVSQTKIAEIFTALFGDQVEEIADPDGEKHEGRVGN